MIDWVDFVAPDFEALWRVVAAVKGVPAVAQAGLESTGAIHRTQFGRNVSIAQVPRAVARWNGHAA
jgi:hypothetical protein